VRVAHCTESANAVGSFFVGVNGKVVKVPVGGIAGKVQQCVEEWVSTVGNGRVDKKKKKLSEYEGLNTPLTVPKSMPRCSVRQKAWRFVIFHLIRLRYPNHAL